VHQRSKAPLWTVDSVYGISSDEEDGLMMLSQTGKYKHCDVKSLRNGENHEDAVHDDRYPSQGSNTELVLLYAFPV
jgi:hypothetical protein